MDERERALILNSMPADEAFVQSLVKRPGVIRLDQLLAITNFEGINNDSVKHYLKHLVSIGDRIEIANGRFIEDAGAKKVEYNRYECMWDIVKSQNNVDLETLDKADKPADLMYCGMDGNIYVDTFITTETLYKVLYLQERFFQRQTRTKEGKYEKHEDILWNIFVVNSMDVANAIADMEEIVMPYRICLVKYGTEDHSDTPKVQYFVSNNNN